MTRDDLRQQVIATLETAGFQSFIPPLERRGFHLIEEPRDANVLRFLERRFGRPVNGKPIHSGVVIFPLGFGDRLPIWNEAFAYSLALEEAGLRGIILDNQPRGRWSWNFSTYVFVPLP